jgi:phage tail-like protein
MALVTPGDVTDAELIGSWFGIKLDNGITGTFSDVKGLSIEINVITITNSDKDTFTRNRPGTTKYQQLTLTRTLSADKSFWNWVKDIRDGKDKFRTTGAIMLYDITGKMIGNWTFANAWPSKWSASDLSVGTDDPMQETVELQIELLKREK